MSLTQPHAERQHTFFLASLADDTIKIVCPGTYEEATRVVAEDGERWPFASMQRRMRSTNQSL